VYIWRYMHEDMGRLFSLGDVVAWDVLLVDGQEEGWPPDILVDTMVRIEERPHFALSGSSARTPEFSACWRGDQAVGSTFRISAGLVADFFNPPFRTTATGAVKRIQVVARGMALEDCVWTSTGEWRLTDIEQSPRSLAPHPDDPVAEQQDGLLVALELRSLLVRPFSERNAR
ncbi:MAG: hypothetical protein M3065_19760, partial [Actinomycetota bacterium]|nr:hypothetical protein [Actinomycetota bacterium]